MLRYKLASDKIVTDNIETDFKAYKTANLSGSYFNKRLLYAVVEDNGKIVPKCGMQIQHHITVLTSGTSVDATTDYDGFVKSNVRGEAMNSDLGNDFIATENITLLDTSKSVTEAEKVLPKAKYNYSFTNSVLIRALTDRFFRLPVVKTFTTDNGTYVLFENTHYYNRYEKNIAIWLNFSDGGERVNVELPCDWINFNVLRVKSFSPRMSCTNDGINKSVGSGVVKTILTNENLLNNTVFMRESPFYGYDTVGKIRYDRFTAFTYSPQKTISVALSSPVDTNMLQSDSLKCFVSDEKNNAINRIIEMEKDVYHPVILHTSFNADGKPSDTDIDSIEEVYKIMFNFHFREHREEDWSVESTDDWNGTYRDDEDMVTLSIKDTEGKEITKEEYPKMKLMDEKYCEDNVNGANFFETYDTIKDKDDNFSKRLNPSRQSDLLSYLGFSDSDVKFQKNKLKKSFIRLSFYDSMNPANQNLLSYSTIFVDSGDLYGRYLKYGGLTASDRTNKQGDYTSISYMMNKKGELVPLGKTNLDGIRCDREFVYVVRGRYVSANEFEDENGEVVELEEHRIYCNITNNKYYRCVKDYSEKNNNKSRLKLIVYDGKDNINPEERRLSSQLTVEGRDTGIASSEGFYLYLWKDNDGGIMPTDIYMKVEYNHAGYGRTIPFIMPYWDKDKTTMTGIKTFQDIVDDWNQDSAEYYNKVIDGVEWTRNDTRYTVRDYAKYSYIHFKYRYDAVNERHIYYMDDTVYGNNKDDEERSIYFKDNTITLNLYEVKII